MSIKLMKARWITTATEPESPFDVDNSQNTSSESHSIDLADTIDAIDCNEQQEMPEFKLIETSVFISYVPRESRAMRCMCDRNETDGNEEKCGENCLNRVLHMECGSRCPYGSQCTNKAFQKRQYCQVEPFFAGVKGWGLCSKTSIRAGSFVIEYIGDVVDELEFKRRRRRYGRDPRHKHHYFMGYRNGAVIDATMCGNLSRFINHSCSPNTETQKWTVDRQLRIGFFTTEDITAGQEITFDYKLERYGKEAQKCYCGSENCRGIIGNNSTIPTEEQFDDDGEDDDDDEENEQDGNRSENDQRFRNRRRKQLLMDEQMSRDLEQLMRVGKLKNRKHVIDFNRLMVRGDDFPNRMKMLDLLMETEEATLRLFVDNHGLKLIWMWLVDDENIEHGDLLILRLKLLAVLEKLPIQTKNQIEDAGLGHVLRRFIDSVAKKRTPKNSIVSNVLDSLVDTVVENEHSEGLDLWASYYGDGDSERSSCSPPECDQSDGSQHDQQRLRQSVQVLLDSWQKLKDNYRIPRKVVKVPKKDTVLRRSNLDRPFHNSKASINRFRTNTWSVRPGFRINDSLFGPPTALHQSRVFPSFRSQQSFPMSSPQPPLARPSLPPPVTCSSDVVDLSWLLKDAPEPPPIEVIAPRKRSSRFDRRTPPLEHAIEFALWERSLQQLFPIPDNLIWADQSATSVYHSIVTIVCHCFENEKPGILVRDFETNSSWWRDQNSGRLVYEATEEQMKAVEHGDWSNVPLFKYNADEGTIREVRLNTSMVEEEVDPIPVLPVESSSPSNRISFVEPLSPCPLIVSSSSTLANVANKKIVELEHQLSYYKKIAETADTLTTTDKSTISPTPVPPPPPTTLPFDWSSAVDEQGCTYYYHLTTRETQWDRPEQNEPTTTTAAADTSGEVNRELRGIFKAELAKHVGKTLEPFRKAGRFANPEDFKYFARKLSHSILSKEEKRCAPDELQVTDSVKRKSKDYIKEYMKKFGKSPLKRAGK